MIIKSKQRLLDLRIPKVMGIINVTPDSFYEGSRLSDPAVVIDRVREMLVEGMDIVDIGAVSSRPGAEEVSTQEEQDRLLPVITALREAYPDLWISVDTYRAAVLQACMEVGIDIVNDISGGELDPSFLEEVARHQLPYILMHMQGVPSTMQDAPSYQDVTLSLLKYFDQKIDVCRSAGIRDIIIDPGFGFGKMVEHNYTLLRRMSSFQIFDLPILVGLSRKSMIYKVLGTTPDQALTGTSAAHMMALQNGANILRVHDVRAAVECIHIWQSYTGKNTST